MSNPKGQAVLFVGDLSYADDHPNHDQRKWDSYGRFVEPSAAYQPWIWAAGNHEIDYAPSIVTIFHIFLKDKRYKIKVIFKDIMLYVFILFLFKDIMLSVFILFLFF